MAGLLTKVLVKVGESRKKRVAELKLLNRRELTSVLKLFYEEGWVDFTLADLEYMYRMSPKTCFKFVSDGEMIGVTFALLLDNGVCYPNSSIIAERFRAQVKYHEQVLKYAEFLKQVAQFEVMYSARWLVDIYRDAMGYREVGDIHRFRLPANQDPEPQFEVHPLTVENLKPVADFLFKQYRSERLSLLEHAIRHRFATAVISENGEVTGFGMRRPLPKHDHIGPVVAADETQAAFLIKHLAASGVDKQVLIDGNPKILAGLFQKCSIEFEEEGTKMVKMIRGDDSLRENEAGLYAIYSHYLS